MADLKGQVPAIQELAKILGPDTLKGIKPLTGALGLLQDATIGFGKATSFDPGPHGGNIKKLPKAVEAFAPFGSAASAMRRYGNIGPSIREGRYSTAARDLALGTAALAGPLMSMGNKGVMMINAMRQPARGTVLSEKIADISANMRHITEGKKAFNSIGPLKFGRAKTFKVKPTRKTQSLSEREATADRRAQEAADLRGLAFPERQEELTGPQVPNSALEMLAQQAQPEPNLLGGPLEENPIGVPNPATVEQELIDSQDRRQERGLAEAANQQFDVFPSP